MFPSTDIRAVVLVLEMLKGDLDAAADALACATSEDLQALPLHDVVPASSSNSRAPATGAEALQEGAAGLRRGRGSLDQERPDGSAGGAAAAGHVSSKARAKAEAEEARATCQSHYSMRDEFFKAASDVSTLSVGERRRGEGRGAAGYEASIKEVSYTPFMHLCVSTLQHATVPGISEAFSMHVWLCGRHSTLWLCSHLPWKTPYHVTLLACVPACVPLLSQVHAKHLG